MSVRLLNKASEKNLNSRDETEVEIELCPEKTNCEKLDEQEQEGMEWKRTGEMIRKIIFMNKPTIHNVNEHLEFRVLNGEEEAHLGGKIKKECLWMNLTQISS